MILEQLKRAWYEKVLKHGLKHEQATINMRPLMPEEAIGRPTRDGYPLLQGREVMIQAELREALGHAFTDEPSNYVGPLSDINVLPLDTNAARARLVAAINATYALLGSVKGTRHCRDSGPEACAAKIAEHVMHRHGLDSKVVMVGFQPAIVYHMSNMFKNIRVTDMNSDNIGKIKQGVALESHQKNKEAIEWSDIVLATGSTLVNGSIDDIQAWARETPLYFYGVTVAAAACELNLNRLCFESR
ncbi:Rossmann-like domain-containing protein [[Eubacterium] cellulosolvens]